MRLLVTGASGLLGLNLALRAQGLHQVIGLDRGRLTATPFEMIHQDLLKPDSAQAILDRAQPDALVNCAAAADVDFCESRPEVAQKLNADVPGELAHACGRDRVRFMQISTDAVFDGDSSAPYTEADAPNPRSVYAVTKLAGERAVAQADPDALIVRVNFYGWSVSGRRSLAEYFFRNLEIGKRISGFTDVVFCPTYVGHLATTVFRMLESDLRGLYHAVGAEAMSKYDFGLAIARRFGQDETLILPRSVEESDLAATRSHNLHLSINKLSTDLGGPLADFSTGLDEFYTEHVTDFPTRIRGYEDPKFWEAALGADPSKQAG
jgi:dTDP-4-dehydrorhamnose reductase